MAMTNGISVSGIDRETASELHALAIDILSAPAHEKTKRAALRMISSVVRLPTNVEIKECTVIGDKHVMAGQLDADESKKEGI